MLLASGHSSKKRGRPSAFAIAAIAVGAFAYGAVGLVTGVIPGTGQQALRWALFVVRVATLVWYAMRPRAGFPPHAIKSDVNSLTGVVLVQPSMGQFWALAS